MSVGEGRRIFFEIDTVLTEMLTVNQAAYHYNFHSRTIRKWCEEGKFFAVEIEGRWWIPINEIEAFLKRNDISKNL